MNLSTRRTLIASALVATLGTSQSLLAEEYDIDPAHSFVQFTISHLGIGVVNGRFNDLKGAFSYDEADPAAAKIRIEAAASSIDSNWAVRDKHIRSKDFLEVDTYPTIVFESTGFKPEGNNGVVTGKLTLHGVTQEISVPVTQIGAGKDPWGGFRRAFEGSFDLLRSDYGINYDLGPKAASMKVDVFIEGIRK